MSSYARLPSASSTKMWRGTFRIRSSTARLVMPCSLRRWTSRSRVRAEVMPMPAKRASTIQVVQPGLHAGDGRMAREIDLQGSHGNEAFLDGVEVGALEPRPDACRRGRPQYTGRPRGSCAESRAPSDGGSRVAWNGNPLIMLSGRSGAFTLRMSGCWGGFVQQLLDEHARHLRPRRRSCGRSPA